MASIPGETERLYRFASIERMVSRRRLLAAGIGAAAAGIGYPVLVEPRWFEVTHHSVGTPSPSGDSARILQLTDLHASWAVPLSSIQSAIQTGISWRPDVVCLTGDFITHRDDFDVPKYVAVLKQLSAAAPTFAVLGNHDGGAWAQERGGYPDHKLVENILDEAGITLLHNCSRNVVIRGRNLALAGVGDLWSDEIDAARAFQDVRPDRGRVVLLSHNPDSKNGLRVFPWDLMLCGHTHGGQVLIPFQGPRFAPVEDRRFVAGLHAWAGRQIYTSRGVGNLGSVRFRCRPEITLLDVALA